MSDVRARAALSADRLSPRIDPSVLPFATTDEVAPLAGTFGQPRAIDALAFALEIDAPGFHPFVAGAPGSGRRTTVLEQARRLARERPAPPDWVYVHGASPPADRPRAISLPAGRAPALAADLDRFVEHAQREIPRAFESEDYERRRRAALADVSEQRRALAAALETFARERGFAVELGDAQLAVVPMRGDEPIDDAAFARLPAEERREIELRHDEIQEHAAQVVRRIRQLEADGAERVRELDEQVARFAVGVLLEDLEQAWRDVPAVLEHLAWIEQDLPRHLDTFWVDAAPPFGAEPRDEVEGEAEGPDEQLVDDVIGHLRRPRPDRGGRWRANVLVTRAPDAGAPVVEERNPTAWNLVGRIELRPTLGAMVSDYRHLKAGALHLANGGFLVLRASDVMSQPHAWEVLKRSLRAASVSMELPADGGGGPSATTLDPEPIPLSVKVVLLGAPELFQALWDQDPDFRELFHVKVEFAPDVPLSPDNVLGYAAFVARAVRDLGLRPFDREAVARLAEHGLRESEHQGKLSARLRTLSDVAVEASYWAKRNASDVVSVVHVERAIGERERRSGWLEERVREEIVDGTVSLDVDGARVGRVNGLVVLDVGDREFGVPMRVGASVGIGRGTVVSVEREARMSGPIHDKGVLTLVGYLAERHAQKAPLSIAATISFEQAYDLVEGDSASSTELYALLSALADAPIDQGIAVTGSVSQSGEVQPVGGVSRKIEGFFEVCRARGLTGRQGVIVPAGNARHLVLDDRVVAAVREGRFHVWAVCTIDEGMEILTGLEPGERDADGEYPEGTLHHRVAAKLAKYATACGALTPWPGGA